MTTTEVREVFAVLRPALTELVRTAPQVDASFLHGSFDPDAQRRFAERVLATLGFEEGAWRLDPTAHPFCTSFSNRDVRLTTRYRPDDLESVWSTLHEAGHGLYAHGIADSLMRTPLGGAPSLGDQRVAEPDVGEPRRPQPAVLDALVRAAAGDVPRAARRRRPRRVRARDQPRRARADPRRRRRDDLLAPHHPPLRARAGADRGHGRARGPAGDLERADEGVPRRRRALGQPTACCRTCTGRAAGSATSRRMRSATSSRCRSGRRCARRSPTSTRRWRPASCSSSPTGCATTSTRTAAS